MTWFQWFLLLIGWRKNYVVFNIQPNYHPMEATVISSCTIWNASENEEFFLNLVNTTDLKPLQLEVTNNTYCKRSKNRRLEFYLPSNMPTLLYCIECLIKDRQLYKSDPFLLGNYNMTIEESDRIENSNTCKQWPYNTSVTVLFTFDGELNNAYVKAEYAKTGSAIRRIFHKETVAVTEVEVTNNTAKMELVLNRKSFAFAKSDFNWEFSIRIGQGKWYLFKRWGVFTLVITVDSVKTGGCFAYFWKYLKERLTGK